GIGYIFLVVRVELFQPLVAGISFAIWSHVAKNHGFEDCAHGTGSEGIAYNEFTPPLGIDQVVPILWRIFPFDRLGVESDDFRCLKRSEPSVIAASCVTIDAVAPRRFVRIEQAFFFRLR